MATQADILTATRERLDETSAYVWTDAELRRYTNEVVRDISRRTLANRAEKTIYSIADMGEYNLPDDTIQVHQVEYEESGHTAYPEYRDRHSMQNMWGAFQNQSGWPAVYTTWGMPPKLKMRLYPVPSVSAAEIRVLYYRFPANLATADTTDALKDVDIPTGYEDVLVDGVEAKALRKGRDPRWQEAQALYEANLAEMAHLTMRFTDQAGQVDWNGTPSWLTDFGGY